MPKVAKGKRKRAYRPRTSSGCLTCKIRRIKCDEAKPACLRCISTRRACDGYSSDPIKVPVTIIVGPSFDISACPRSRRSFAFFTRRTCPQLAGFFGSDFWERLVPRAAHHEPAIQHAIVALGALHEHQTTRTDAGGGTFALEQYNLAIRSLLAPQSQNRGQGVDVCLMSCIIFTSFENMRGHHTSAGSHIRSGSKILQETAYDERSGSMQHQVLGSKGRADSYVSLDALMTIFVGLDTRVATMLRDHNFKAYGNYFSGKLDSDTFSSLSTVEEARNLFDYGRSLFTSSSSVQSPHDTVDCLDTVESHISHCATLLSTFSHALVLFADSRSTLFTPKESIAVAVLRLHVLNIQVSFHLEHLPPAYRSRSEGLLPQMKEMVILGEQVVSTISADNAFEGSTTFCLDMGFIIPLYTVACQCQDPTLRRRAIAALRLTSRQEGLWNSLLVAKASERIMEIEESEGVQLNAYTDDTVQWTMPSSPTILQLDARGGRLQYIRPRQKLGSPICVVEEVFNWQGT